MMVIGERLKALREHKKMSQGDIEKRTGLLRVYISRVENGHTIPSIETLEKIARALEVPMYQLFYDGENPPAPELPKIGRGGWGSSARDARTFDKFRRLFSRANESDRKLLLVMATTMAANRERTRKRKSQD
jgi:transcriptional regulator with XRE-family HTH domain